MDFLKTRLCKDVIGIIVSYQSCDICDYNKKRILQCLINEKEYSSKFISHNTSNIRCYIEIQTTNVSLCYTVNTFSTDPTIYNKYIDMCTINVGHCSGTQKTITLDEFVFAMSHNYSIEEIALNSYEHLVSDLKNHIRQLTKSNDFYLIERKVKIQLGLKQKIPLKKSFWDKW